MKNYIIIFVACISCHLGMSQDLNGVYRASFTNFVNNREPDRDFFNASSDLITVDIMDYPTSGGTVVISSKTNEGEAMNIKLEIVGGKETNYVDGETYISYDCRLLLMNQPDRRKYVISFVWNGGLKQFILFFPSDSHQLWQIGSKL